MLKTILLTLVALIGFNELSHAGALELLSKTIVLNPDQYPEFVSNHNYPKNVVAHYEVEVRIRNYNGTADFYRIERLSEDSLLIIEFIDFSPEGRQLRRGSLINDTKFDYKVIEFFQETGGVKAQYKMHANGDFVTKNSILPEDELFIKNGSIELYHPNGALKAAYMQDEKGMYQDNHLYQRFHPNGKLAYKFKTKSGKLHDTLLHLSAVGDTLEHIIYNEGKPQRELKTLPSEDRRKGLIIAISKNENDLFSINTERDVIVMQEALINNQFKPKNIALLQNEAATLAGIRESFDQYIRRARRGDVCYVQISGNSYEDFLMTYDSYAETESTKWSNLKNTLTYKEILDFTKKLRHKVGPTGQVVLNLDMCGDEKALQDTELNDNVKKQSVGYRAQVISHLNEQENQKYAPVNIIGVDGFAYEIKDDKGRSLGELSYLLSSALTQFPVFDFHDLIENLNNRKTRHNTFLVTGYQDEEIFWPRFSKEDVAYFSSNKDTLTGNAWVVSIGINNYTIPENTSFDFTNCVNDAKTYALVFEQDFNQLKTGEEEIYNHLLINENATKDKIIKVLDSVSKFAGKEDYFIFNFSGYTITLPNSDEKEETWFVTSNIKGLYDTTDIQANGINLALLKGLLQQIDCRNQLFITEAGNTQNFGREFTKALIEDQSISQLVDRNRLILTPTGMGFDYFDCENKKIESGPINYFLSSLPPEMNLFYLFSEEDLSEQVEYTLSERQFKCGFSYNYFTLHREKEILADLTFYNQNAVAASRGARAVFREEKTRKKLGKKSALIIGTNEYYSSNGEWGNLKNPVNDAKAIASTLVTKYGFDVDLLIDPPLDTIYSYLFDYSTSLDSTDQFILFIAGHGDFDQYLDDGMIVCNDSKSSIDDVGRNSYLQFGKLSRIINRFKSKQILVWLDVCFGGTFDAQVALRNNRSRTDMYESRSSEKFVDDQLKLNTRKYMTSGAKNEVPDGYGKHSPFAHVLLQVLRNSPSESEVLTGSKIYSYLQTLDSKPLFGSFGEDEPGSDFMLIGASN